MKVLIFALILTYISAINSYEIKQIEGVEGDCIVVLFDSKFNSYLRCTDLNTDNTERLYKLDPENNIVFAKTFVDFACRIMLNDKDELYLICPQFSEDSPSIVTTDIRIIRANSSEIKSVISLKGGISTIFQDNNGNLMYSAGRGLYFLKYNSSEPVAVKNLENFQPARSIAVTDQNGDTYVGGEDSSVGQHQIVVISAASKEGTPEGYAIEGLFDDPVNDFVSIVRITPNNELLISIKNDNRKASLKKSFNGTVSTIYSNESYEDYVTYPGKTRTLIVAYNSLNNKCRITSMSLDGETFEVQNQRNEPWTAESKDFSIDQEGNAYFTWDDLVARRSRLEFLNYTDTTTVEVGLVDNPYVWYIAFDGNNNLWMNTNHGVYVIEQGGFEVQAVPDSRDLMDMFVNTNRKESQVYINTEFRFFVISN